MEEKPAYLERTQVKLEFAKNVHEKFEVKLCDNDFVIYPNVFNPNIFFGTEFLAKELIKAIAEFSPNQPKFLEIGTGAGYMSILALLNGVSNATSTDINPDALENAEENSKKFGMIDRMIVKQSDVFDDLKSDEKFDIIFWNHPFGHVNKPTNELDMLERALLDPFYRSLDKYLQMAHGYLTPNEGRLFISFSVTAGDKNTFDRIANKYGWNIQLRNEIKSNTNPIMQIGLYELKKIQ